jgi:hypothetical protein
MISQAVRVILTGICTFVGAGVGSTHRPMTAVFPNASHHDPVHHVSLIILEDEYDVDTDAPSETVYNQLGQQFRVVLLDGKSIALAGVVDTETELKLLRPELSATATKEHRPTNLEEMRSVEWIPSLGRSWPRIFPLRSARRMKEGFYGAAPDPQLVGARFELPHGVLSSFWVSGDVWRLTPRTRTRRPFETAIAQEVSFETHVGNGAIHFDLCDLGTNKHCGYVRVARRGRPIESEPIQVVIANVPDGDRLPGSMVFCGECGRSECEAEVNDGTGHDPFPCTCVDHHYANYYHAFSTRMPKHPPLPRRVSSGPPLIPVAMRVGGGNCAPSGYP